jgi:hypothetical protein
MTAYPEVDGLPEARSSLTAKGRIYPSRPGRTDFNQMLFRDTFRVPDMTGRSLPVLTEVCRTSIKPAQVHFAQCPQALQGVYDGNWWVDCCDPSLKGFDGTGSKETSNEKKTKRAFVAGQTFKTDQSETIDFGRFKTTIRTKAGYLRVTSVN